MEAARNSVEFAKRPGAAGGAGGVAGVRRRPRADSEPQKEAIQARQRLYYAGVKEYREEQALERQRERDGPELEREP